jgi:hypothetical protein
MASRPVCVRGCPSASGSSYILTSPRRTTTAGIVGERLGRLDLIEELLEGVGLELVAGHVVRIESQDAHCLPGLGADQAPQRRKRRVHDDEGAHLVRVRAGVADAEGAPSEWPPLTNGPGTAATASRASNSATTASGSRGVGADPLRRRCRTRTEGPPSGSPSRRTRGTTCGRRPLPARPWNSSSVARGGRPIRPLSPRPVGPTGHLEHVKSATGTRSCRSTAGELGRDRRRIQRFSASVRRRWCERTAGAAFAATSPSQERSGTRRTRCRSS